MALMQRGGPAIASAVLLAAAGTLLSSTVASAQQDAEARVREYETRFREYEPRVREYRIRTQSLDGLERNEVTTEERTVIFDADVLFEFDSDELTSEAQSRLDGLAEDLEQLGPREVTISGHTDAEGSDEYNQDLSERRAASVRQALDDHLGDGFAFDVTGYGETQPVADNDSEEARALNRRVEVSFPTD